MTNNTRRRLLALGTAVGLACTLTPAATAQEGNGNATDEEIAFYENYEVTSLAVGALLERGVLECTIDLDEAMQDAGMDHQGVHYKDYGSPNWIQFNQELQPAWDHIKPALMDDAEL